MRRTIRPRTCWLVAIIAGLVCHAEVLATQHLVRPGDSWSELGPRLRPGDEIILMPGRHRPATFDLVRGTPAQPITIRGLDPAHPAVIDAHRDGVRLCRSVHVVIRDLSITGATVNGITITDAEHEPEAVDEPDAGGEHDGPHGHIVIDNVTVERTGPTGRRHAVQLEGVEKITIRNCRFSGWGGAAVEMTAAKNVTIHDCRFNGRPEFGQLVGIQARAGTDNVNVEHCTFSNVGTVAVVIGGMSRREEFRLPANDEPRPGTVFEARRVQVRHCLIAGADTAVAFINCVDSRFSNNTIVRPRRWAYLVHDEPRDPPFGTMRRCAFGANLIVWEPGDLHAFSFASDQSSEAGLTLEENLWWSPAIENERESLGEHFGGGRWPQVMNVNPKLDATFAPTEPLATSYGMASP